jgi:hypothetical protein
MVSSSIHRRSVRSRGFLSGILTVNAVLLAALVWTNITEGPSRAEAAPVAPVAQSDDPPQIGVPNAGAQRERLIAEVRSLREDVRALEQAVNSGRMKVTISNFSELKKIMDEAAARGAAAATKPEQAAAQVTPTAAPKP